MEGGISPLCSSRQLCHPAQGQAALLRGTGSQHLPTQTASSPWAPLREGGAVPPEPAESRPSPHSRGSGEQALQETRPDIQGGLLQHSRQSHPSLARRWDPPAGHRSELRPSTTAQQHTRPWICGFCQQPVLTQPMTHTNRLSTCGGCSRPTSQLSGAQAYRTLT